MDSSFTFPPPQAPVPRVRTGGAASNGPRQSNALRASVLDAALQLGLTNNSLVAEWMFSNSVQEEDEEESLQSPGLTHSSSATSDDYTYSSRGPTTPPSAYAYAPPASTFGINGQPLAAWNNDIDSMPYLRNDPSSSSSAGNQIAFPTSSQDIPVPSRPVTPNSSRKLLKKKKNDEYDSDGGYLSEGVVKKKKGGLGDLMKKDKAQLKEEKREEKRQLKELKEEERKRKKSLGAASKASKKQQQQEEGGYETDSSPILKSPFKSKSKKNKSKAPSTDAADYETDGYQSAGSNLKKNKSRFFGLGSKSSRGDLREPVPAIPEPPSEPPMPLPIAQKFATALPALSDTGSFSANLTIQTDLTVPSISPSISSAATARPSDPQSPQSPERQQQSSIDKRSPSIKDYLKLDIESSTMTASSPTTANVQDRSSLSSAESSSSVLSSNSRRRGFQFSPTRENSNSSISTGHTAGESVSTVNSSTFSHPSVSMLPPSQQAAPPTSFSSIPYSPPGSSSGASLKPPSISLPLTRSQSPILNLPPVAPLQITKSPRAHPDNIDSRGVSPLPLSPSSPYPSTTPTVASPGFGGGASPPRDVPFSAAASSSAAAATSRPTTPRRPMNPPTEGFGPRLNVSSPPPGAVSGRLSPNPSGRLSPNPALRGRLISPLLLPQPNANGDPSPLPSPNVLAYYDIPPPSPPPQGPLPSVPSGAAPPPQTMQGSQLRQRMLLEKEREGDMMLGAPQQHIQRGRESPFPKRPLAVPNPNPMVVSLPSSPHPHHNPQSQSHLPLRLQQGRGGPARNVRFNEQGYQYSSGSNSGNSSREASPDYGYPTTTRERMSPPAMYAHNAGSSRVVSPLPGPQSSSSHDWSDNSHNRFSAASGSAEGLAYDAPEVEEKNVRGVRFAPGVKDEEEEDEEDEILAQHEISSSSDHFHAPPARPRPRPPRRRSFDSDVNGVGVERETIYQWEDDLSKNRESRWSGSIYSRVSIMDPDQSEDARERFVQRVQAMMKGKEDEDGRDVIPPVPRIPEGLANAGSYNKF